MKIEKYSVSNSPKGKKNQDGQDNSGANGAQSSTEQKAEAEAHATGGGDGVKPVLDLTGGASANTSDGAQSAGEASAATGSSGSMQAAEKDVMSAAAVMSAVKEFLEQKKDLDDPDVAAQCLERANELLFASVKHHFETCDLSACGLSSVSDVSVDSKLGVVLLGADYAGGLSGDRAKLRTGFLKNAALSEKGVAVSHLSVHLVPTGGTTQDDTGGSDDVPLSFGDLFLLKINVDTRRMCDFGQRELLLGGKSDVGTVDDKEKKIIVSLKYPSLDVTPTHDHLFCFVDKKGVKNYEEIFAPWLLSSIVDGEVPSTLEHVLLKYLITMVVSTYVFLNGTWSSEADADLVDVMTVRDECRTIACYLSAAYDGQTPVSTFGLDCGLSVKEVCELVKKVEAALTAHLDSKATEPESATLEVLSNVVLSLTLRDITQYQLYELFPLTPIPSTMRGIAARFICDGELMQYKQPTVADSITIPALESALREDQASIIRASVLTHLNYVWATVLGAGKAPFDLADARMAAKELA